MKTRSLVRLSILTAAVLAAAGATPAQADPSVCSLGLLRVVTYDLWATTGDVLIVGRDAYQSGPGPLTVAEALILEFYGQYWFWPTWTPDLDVHVWTMEPGETYTTTYLEIPWIPGAIPGTMSFWGGLMDPDTWAPYALDHLQISWQG